MATLDRDCYWSVWRLQTCFWCLKNEWLLMMLNGHYAPYVA